MKKTILTLLTCLIAAFVFAQAPKPTEPVKQDTVLRTEWKLDQYRAVLSAIDANVDSKKASKEIIEFIARLTKIVQPAENPKAADKSKKP